jgi:hypothetical protein
MQKIKFVLKHFNISKFKFQYRVTNKNFSEKDEKFWQEYSKRKAQGGIYPALESQEIHYNKTLHSWKYASKHSLTNEEFVGCLSEANPKENLPFIILDVRDEHEFEIYKMPSKTKVKLLIINIERNNITNCL